ncbi:hypothetical protein [Clostridium folliculivorans]|uniref:Uncharacterized protein n=1 Tax=Clostridium folliculivorans TaxID=2886038 RepID=A0A9W5Y547_9CLOT|nr:hypothetical protein [Clostridium folliculivorans]GKU26764.1 hypothetical protein CFOLD11_35910 [Clostridium folliculivorans]GKU31358.1 hypothetical protein CFB3_34650 [Clostridium folliculivorans]
MESQLSTINQMFLIGSTGRNSGKTTLATALIEKFKKEFLIIALKITTIEHKDGKCPRGGDGCGVCTNIQDNFELIEEVSTSSNKDTSLLLKAGAEKVYWLKCLQSHLDEGMEYFMSVIPKNSLIICESNSLRNIIVPGSFVMIKNVGNNIAKKSASAVISKADFILENDFSNSIGDFVDKVVVDKENMNIKINSAM